MRHIENTRAFGIPVVVAINAFATDTDAELEAVKQAALTAGEGSTTASVLFCSITCCLHAVQPCIDAALGPSSRRRSLQVRGSRTHV